MEISGKIRFPPRCEDHITKPPTPDMKSLPFICCSGSFKKLHKHTGYWYSTWFTSWEEIDKNCIVKIIIDLSKPMNIYWYLVVFWILSRMYVFFTFFGSIQIVAYISFLLDKGNFSTFNIIFSLQSFFRIWRTLTQFLITTWY